MKSDPATANIPVFGIALGLAGSPPCSNDNVLGNQGELEGSVDFGNSHPYPAGNPFHPDFDYDFLHNYYHNNLLPSAMLDPSPVPGLTGHDDGSCMSRQPYGNKPMVATETGIALFDGGIPESHLSALIPRILLENFRQRLTAGSRRRHPRASWGTHGAGMDLSERRRTERAVLAGVADRAAVPWTTSLAVLGWSHAQ